MQHSILAHLFFLLTILLTACDPKQNSKSEAIKSVIFFDPIKFSAPYHKTTLTIEARFSECGEWGGHKEGIIISADTNKRFYATYKVFPFNCDSLENYYGKENLVPITTKTMVLNETTKKSIIDYIQRLTQSKISERFPGHAGNIFSVVDSDSTLYIQVYDNKEFDIESFKQLVAELTK